MSEDMLASWRDAPSKRAIVEFVESVATGADAIPGADRVAVFDNDGTLWMEKPVIVQLQFLLGRWREELERDPSLADRQPYTAIASGDLGWLGAAIDKHYAGDDDDLHTLIGAIVSATKDLSVEEYASSVADFYAKTQHPTLQRPLSESVYQPMVELIRYLHAHGFTCYIVSAAERDFMRPMSEDYYGIPPERVVGSAYGLAYDPASGDVRYTADLSFFDDGPEKPVRIWNRIGRRPIIAGGNANGDMPMLDYTLKSPKALALLVHHDDPDRGDIPYEKGAEKALAEADTRGYVTISVKDDWSQVFPDPA